MNDPRAEAFERLGGHYEVRVLEPSPPAVNEPPWFADDPVARGEVPPGRQLVSPVAGGDLRWQDLADGDPELAAWCAERWLAAYWRLEPLPPAFTATREDLHRLAETRISPARQRVNQKIGLRYTRGGFGTPFFGEDEQLRVVGDELVTERGRLTKLERLTVDRAAALCLGDWYGFAASVLEELRAGPGADHEPSPVQLWPEHFDLALELGEEQRGARANYGFSPGDEAHDEPYAYVGPWEPRQGELWQARTFAGAELSYPELLEAPDQRAATLEFFTVRLADLVD